MHVYVSNVYVQTFLFKNVCAFMCKYMKYAIKYSDMKCRLAYILLFSIHKIFSSQCGMALRKKIKKTPTVPPKSRDSNKLHINFPKENLSLPL